MNPTVHEVIDASEAEFITDEATGKMSARVNIIKSGNAKGKLKPRRYSSESIRRAAKEGVYDGIRMFVNHSDKPPIKRQMGELVSAIESTEYDPKKDAVVGTVEFFDKDFFEYAQRAKKHIGVSADHSILIHRVQEGRQEVEDVRHIEFARSVDWVVYPAAGGDIISFARESEGAEEVDWNSITPELLKEHAPETYAQIAQEGKETDPPPAPLPTPPVPPAEPITKEAIALMVQEGVQTVLNTAAEKQDKRDATTKKVRDYVSKAGLRGRTQDRLVNQFSDATEYVEADVKEAVEEAQAELVEAGVKPKVGGMGASGTSGEADPATPTTRDARESVETFFKGPKKVDPATKEPATSGKES